MIKGILFYKSEDYERNKWFANGIISYGRICDLDIELFIFDPYNIEQAVEKAKIVKASFALVRTIGSLSVNNLNQALEQEGIRVFNNSFVSKIANNKMETFLWALEHGLLEKGLVMESKLVEVNPLEPVAYFDLCMEMESKNGFVMKTCDGHGGSEVFFIDNEKSYTEALDIIGSMRLCVLQNMCDEPGIDMRVYVLGGNILAAVQRENKASFKSNFSLGGSATLIPNEELTPDQLFVIKLITDELKPDFVGIDFIRNKGKWVLNEIEDAVGCRMLYQVTKLDPLRLYVEYVAASLKRTKD